MKERSLCHRLLPSVIAAALLIMPWALNGQVAQVNFSGEWSFDASRSNVRQSQEQPLGPRSGGPGRAGPGGSDFTARHDGNNLVVERTLKTPDGTASTVILKYTLDGRECVNSSRNGSSRSVASWSPDGSRLTINTTRMVNRGGDSRTATSTEVWSLTDPKTLAVETTMASPGGDRKMTSVYIKK